MPRLPQELDGEILKVRNKVVEFDFWPTIATDTRRTTQSRIFVSDPFSYIGTTLRDNLEGRTLKEAQSYLRQSQDFFKTANYLSEPSTAPLLLYYSFLNLVRCYLLYCNNNLGVKNTHHGLNLDFETLRTSLNTMKLGWHPFGESERNLFDGFVESLGGQSVGEKKKTVKSSQFFSQILVGHRIWSDAQNKNERFVSIDRINFLKSSENIWASLDVSRSTLSYLGMQHSAFLKQTGLALNWKLVSATKSYINENCAEVARFELKQPIRTRSPADAIHRIVEPLHLLFWRSVKQTPPYRKYYLLPVDRETDRVPQLASILAGFFIFGSIVRYRPQKFEVLLNGSYGAFIHEFMKNQARQFLFLMASQFAKREVSKANIV